MRYASTRGGSPVGLDAALTQGIAAGGGLFVPERLPEIRVDDFAGRETLPAVAGVLLAPFFDGSALAGELDGILEETFSFPIPTTALPADRGFAGLLELYHGPTAAFKDVGAGFLAACLARLEAGADRPLTILVATSGDTGGAVAAAFDGRPGMRVVVLYPDGRVSGRQEHQLTAFDDCQALVKAAFADTELTQRYRFSSANSINIGRLLPQSTYYAAASLAHWRKRGTCPGFIVPTGNLGNALACILAREMGLPIGPIILATNANRTIADYFERLEWLPRPSVGTLASAMDVGDPSNMERLRGLMGDATVLRERLGVVAVEDAAIRAAIRADFDAFGFATCPHTATATHAWRSLDSGARAATDWILVATAHPAKFETVVEPLIGARVPLPPGLAEILARPSRSVAIEPGLEALGTAMQAHFGR